MVVGGVYRAPKGNKTQFIDFFETLFDTDHINKNNVLTVGAFNINLLEDNTLTKRFLQVSKMVGFKQIILKSTRCTDMTKSLIDHVFTSISYLEEIDGNYHIYLFYFIFIY